LAAAGLRKQHSTVDSGTSTLHDDVATLPASPEKTPARRSTSPASQATAAAAPANTAAAGLDDPVPLYSNIDYNYYLDPKVITEHTDTHSFTQLVLT